MRTLALVGVVFIAVLTMGASCRTLPEDRGSEFARTAGQSTLIMSTAFASITDPNSPIQLGAACGKPLEMGWKACQLSRDVPLPTLEIAMLNPGAWAISDCQLNLWAHGSVATPGIVRIDLAPLTDQARQAGFCLLKIETDEQYPDNRDKKQFHTVPISGGFFVEMLDSGFNPVPPPAEVAWCYKVYRTVKGRTVMEPCK